MQLRRAINLRREEAELVVVGQEEMGLAAQEEDHCLSLAQTVNSKENKTQKQHRINAGGKWFRFFFLG